jgi:hypothetical protein
MEHPLTKIAKFYTKFNEFRATQTYTDVCIKCNDEEFMCHVLVLAAASEFFHLSVLGGNFKESAKGVLVEVPADVTSAGLAEVLRFAYTGKSDVTADNVYSVLRASEFLRMKDLQDQCIGFVMQKNVTLQNALELFCYACTTQRNALIRELSDYIVQHLNLLYTTSEFLDVPNEGLCMILSRWSMTLSSGHDQRVLARALLRWLHHSRHDRLTYLNERIEILVLPATIRLIIEKYTANDHAFLSKLVGYTDIPNAGVLNKNDTSLYVFGYDEKLLKRVTYSINSTRGCSVISRVPLQYSPQYMKGVVLNDSALYCYNYAMFTQSSQTIYVRPTKHFNPAITCLTLIVAFRKKVRLTNAMFTTEVKF